MNREFAQQSLRLCDQRGGRILQAGRWDAYTGGGPGSGRKVQDPYRRPAACYVFPDPAIAVKRLMAGGAVQPRSRSNWQRQWRAACAIWMPGCHLPSDLEQRAGQRIVCFARGHGFVGRAGRTWRDAGSYGHLWNGGVLGEQAAARAGNPRRSWSAAQRSAGSGAGTRFPASGSGSAAGLRSALPRRECWRSLFTRRRRAIRWFWPVSFSRCCCWGCWLRGFPRSARWGPIRWHCYEKSDCPARVTAVLREQRRPCWK